MTAGHSFRDKAQAKAHIDSLPDGEPILILRPRVQKASRIEKDAMLSMRVPASTREATYSLLDEIGVHIGNHARAVCMDWLLAEGRHALQGEAHE